MINVYTDGSLVKETGIGAWAYWIETSDGNIHLSGGLIKECPLPDYAELYAIYMASCAVAIINTGETVIYWTDSLNAVKMLVNPKRKYKSRTKLRDKTLDMIHQVVYHYNFNYVPRNSTLQLKWCDYKAGTLTNRK